jgi:predicted  nucleic acid-binding Zn-ribbon protein
LHEDLKKLCDLQLIHTAIQEAQKKIDDTPRLVAEIEAVQSQAESDLNSALQKLDDAQKSRRQLEADVSDLEQKLSRYQDQVFQVKKNEEYQALMKEIANAKEEIQSAEDRILEQMERIDEEQAAAQTLDGANQHIRVDCDQKKNDILQEKERMTDEVRRLGVELQTLEGNISPQLLSTFQKLATNREGMAMAQVVDESCLLCSVRVRPQIYQELKLGTALVQCGNCSRFLFLGPESPQGQGGEA